MNTLDNASPVYVVAELSVHDPEKMRHYAEQVRPLLARFGGRILATLPPAPVTVEGDWHPQMLVIQEWPSAAHFHTFWSSADYAPLRDLRRAAARSQIVIVRGVAGRTARSDSAPRIQPVEPPYSPSIGALLDRMTPNGALPIALFRTLVRNPQMAEAMNAWGSYELSKRLSVSLRCRELVIDRVMARLGCEYEWGVHMAYFAERAGFTAEQIASITHGSPHDHCWEGSDRTVLRLVDSLLATATVDDALWSELTAVFSDEQLLDLLALAGWYHAIAFMANVTRVPLEDGTPRFANDTAEPNATIAARIDDA